MNWYFGVLKKYAVFSGRAQRKEYWLFTLCNTLITAVLHTVFGTVFSLLEWRVGGIGVSVVAALYALVVLLPSLAVLVRRLHDTNRSGGYFFFNLIPCVGAIILLVFLVQDSDPDENRYGPNPKATTE